MQNDKAPGMDGLTVAFYKKFWNELRDVLMASVYHAFQVKRFSILQRRRVIKLLLKWDKNPHVVRNLRPITLLPVDLKIVTRALAKRLKLVIDDLVAKDQHTFIQGRYLGNGVMDLYSLAAHGLEVDDDFLAMSLDVEKAFDSISWSFLYKLLHAWGLPESFISWVHIISTDRELRVFHNGHSSQAISITNGVAQGNNLSLLLFILCMESLAKLLMWTH